MLYSHVDVPSRHTLSHDVQEMFLLSKDNVIKVLTVRFVYTYFYPYSSLNKSQSYKGRLHFGVDGWSSPNVFSFLGLTVHRCVNGAIIECILDFIK